MWVECVTTKELNMSIDRNENPKKWAIYESSPLSPEVEDSIVRKNNSNGKTIWDISPLSPPWTTAAVFVLIILFTVIMKIGLSL